MKSILGSLNSKREGNSRGYIDPLPSNSMHIEWKIYTKVKTNDDFLCENTRTESCLQPADVLYQKLYNNTCHVTGHLKLGLQRSLN